MSSFRNSVSCVPTKARGASEARGRGNHHLRQQNNFLNLANKVYPFHDNEDQGVKESSPKKSPLLLTPAEPTSSNHGMPQHKGCGIVPSPTVHVSNLYCGISFYLMNHGEHNLLEPTTGAWHRERTVNTAPYCPAPTTPPHGGNSTCPTMKTDVLLRRHHESDRIARTPENISSAHHARARAQATGRPAGDVSRHIFSLQPFGETYTADTSAISCNTKRHLPSCPRCPARINSTLQRRLPPTLSPATQRWILHLLRDQRLCLVLSRRVERYRRRD